MSGLSTSRLGSTTGSARRPLQVASILALIQYSAHAFLFLSARPHGREEESVVATMQDHRFNVSGFQRSYWDSHIGYGLMVILSGVIEVVILWQLASSAKENGALIRPFVVLFLAANVAHALIAARYFFAAPIVFDAAVAVCLVWALTRKPSPAIVSSTQAAEE